MAWSLLVRAGEASKCRKKALWEWNSGPSKKKFLQIRIYCVFQIALGERRKFNMRTMTWSALVRAGEASKHRKKALWEWNYRIFWGGAPDTQTGVLSKDPLRVKLSHIWVGLRTRKNRCFIDSFGILIEREFFSLFWPFFDKIWSISPARAIERKSAFCRQFYCEEQTCWALGLNRFPGWGRSQ